MNTLEGKVAIVTGAAGSIGGAVCAGLHAAGAEVLGADAVEPADNTEFRTVVADLATEAGAQAVAAAATEAFGRLDIVVCAHGGSGRASGDGPIHECTEEGWDATQAMNLKSVFQTYRQTVPMLLSGGGGAIVSVSSVLGLVGGDRDFRTHAYAAAKGGLISLTRAMATTYAEDGIRCNVVCPGLIRSGMSARAQQSEKIKARLPELQPLTGDFGTPEDVAEAVLYLVAPGSSFVTGAVLTVDGGWTAK